MLSLAEICIRRPVATILLNLVVILAGVLAYQQLPIAALPSFDTPTINVSASLPGASPETMAASVATPLEKQFSTISGLNIISSTSSLGSTSITLEFDPSRNIDAASVDVQAALMRSQRSLPVEMTSLPSYRKVNPADTPVLFVALNSPSMSLSDLNDYALNWISPALSTLNGVAQVNVFGEKRYAVRVKADPEKLAARQLTLDELANVIRAANANTPVGRLEGPEQTLTIVANKQLRNAAEFGELIVATQNGLPLRLKEVAKVEDSVENVRIGSWANGQRSIALAIFRQPDANTVAVSDAVSAILPRLQEQLPQSIRMQILSDRSLSIRDAIRDVKFTMMVTIALVILVIFLFLRRATATLIPAISLPVSLLAAIAIMFWLGYSLDNISLLGLTLAVGLVVDDAIVVLENIVRYAESGMPILEASQRGAREISFTILSISISLVAIFIPIFFMTGVIGLLFHEFAVVVSLAVLASALVSLTLIPLLCSRLLRHDNVSEQESSPFQRLLNVFEASFQAMLRGYEFLLDMALHYSRSVLLVAAITFVLTIVLFMVIPKGFFPTEDTGQILISTEARQDISFAAMVEAQRQVADRIRADAAVFSIMSTVGNSDSSNSGRIFAVLKSKSERGSLDGVMARLRKETADIPGVSVFMNPVQNLRLGGRPSKSRYQYVLQSIQADELSAWSEKLRRELRANELFRDVTSDSQLKGLQAELHIDRDKANQQGVQIQDIRSALYSAFGDRQVATIYTAGDSYPVILTVTDEQRQTEYDLSRLRVRNRNGELVALSSVATVERTVGPTAVNHAGQLQAVTISFNLAPEVSLGEASRQLAQIQQRIQMPANILGHYAGDAAAFAQSQSSQFILIGVALVVIYVLLGVLYESFIHPLTILSGLPSAAVGALLTLMLFHQELTVIATIGILMLIGIVKKNAIMMVDFAIEERRQNKVSAREAIRSACLRRFRPIMMTTMAAMMGAIPIAAGIGSGAELRQPLGLAVVGGLLFSQVITLFITPVIYLKLDKWDSSQKA